MQEELRNITPYIIASLVLIRFWIEVVTTTILKDAWVVNNVNSSTWFHHYQLGLVLLFVVVVIKKLFKLSVKYFYPLAGFSVGLVVDQYTYVLQIFEINSPFSYRSMEDYFVIAIMVFLLAVWSFLGRSAHKIR